MASLGERFASLQSTIDQLNVALEHSSENNFCIQLENLERTLLDINSKSPAGTEKLKDLQKSLMNAENERRVLSERLDYSQQNLAEIRRSKEQLDVVAQLRIEVAGNEVLRAGLESQYSNKCWRRTDSLYSNWGSLSQVRFMSFRKTNFPKKSA